MEMWGFPKIGGGALWGPKKKNSSIWGSILGPPPRPSTRKGYKGLIHEAQETEGTFRARDCGFRVYGLQPWQNKPQAAPQLQVESLA